jgi:hypothetical protein
MLIGSRRAQALYRRLGAFLLAAAILYTCLEGFLAAIGDKEGKKSKCAS